MSFRMRIIKRGNEEIGKSYKEQLMDEKKRENEKEIKEEINYMQIVHLPSDIFKIPKMAF